MLGTAPSVNVRTETPSITRTCGTTLIPAINERAQTPDPRHLWHIWSSNGSLSSDRSKCRSCCRRSRYHGILALGALPKWRNTWGPVPQHMLHHITQGFITMPHQQLSLPAAVGKAPCALRCSHRPFLQHRRALKSGARATRSRSVQQNRPEALRAQPTEAADEVVDLHSLLLLRACSVPDWSAMLCSSQGAPDVLQSTVAPKF